MPEKSHNHSTQGDQQLSGSALRWLTAALLLALFAGLGSAVMSLPVETAGLSVEVEAAMASSGVSHQVTAVLLNFRGYDTLLEMAVLLLALIGVWSLAPATSAPRSPPGAVLERLAQLYVPLMLLTAGYLLWNGAHAPGGAFQGGAVLAAAGVLMFLSGWSLPASLEGWPLRLTVILGLLVFTAVAALLAWRRGTLLDYPPSAAGELILLIETAAAVSIGATLAALFLGGRPGDR